MAENGDRVVLSSGDEVLVRPIRPDDRERLRDAFDRLGERSRYARFLAPKTALTAAELTYLTDVDHVDHEAITATDPDTGEGVGVARYIRFKERREVAEAAIAVVDEWQGRGVGTLLLDRLVDRAQVNGVTRFRASMLVTNRASRELFSRLGDVEVLRQGEGSMDLEVELPLDPPTLQTMLRCAARRLFSLSPRQ
jgi:RimJ/RimL family protein N-acetyltransferase